MSLYDRHHIYIVHYDLTPVLIIDTVTLITTLLSVIGIDTVILITALQLHCDLSHGQC